MLNDSMYKDVKHVYRLSFYSFRYVGTIIFTSAIFYSFWFIFYVIFNVRGGLIAGTVAIIIYWATQWLFTRLIVTPEGLVYESIGIKWQVQWSEIHGLGRSSNLLLSWEQGEGLVVFMTHNAQFTDASKRIHRHVVPLKWFARNWRTSSLGSEIQQYAPGIFRIEPKR